MMNKNCHNKNVCSKKLHKNNRQKGKISSNEESEIFNVVSNSKENVELSLEVEIANSLQQLLSKPENCTSRLLDVTIIRPSKDCSDVNRVETNTVAFGKDDIKDLLTIIDKQNDEYKCKRNRKHCKHTTSLNAKPKYEFKTCKRLNGYISPRRNTCVSAPSRLNPFIRNCTSNTYPSYLRNVEARLIEICNDHIENSGSQMNIDFSSDSSAIEQGRDTSIGDGSNAHHIYAAAHTFDNLRKSLTCKNKPHRCDDKNPCFCERCGTMGVLIESQKGPVLTNAHAPLWNSGPPRSPPKPSTPAHECKTRYVDLRTKYRDNTNIQRINVRLNDLEERLVQQEEESVNKEYFKKIMTKLIAYCHNNKSNLHQANNNNDNIDLKNNSVQCNFNENKYNCKRDVRLNARGKEIDNSYCVNSFIVQENNDDVNTTSKMASKRQHIKSSPTRQVDTFWKWGEEVIKPGVDLKTKIGTLLDEKLNSIQSKINDENCTKIVENVNKCMDYIKNCKTTVNRCSTSSLTNALMDESADEFKKHNNNNNNNNYHKKNYRKKSQINLTKSQYEPILMKHNDKNCNGKPLHVAYISPNVTNWKNESATSMTKIKVKDNATQISNKESNVAKKRLSVEDSLQDKLNCLRELARSRNVDECQLWKNIWYKVKDYARTKHDTVTIQIPTEAIYKIQDKGANQISEIELKITDLFDIVEKSKENSLETIDRRDVVNNRRRLEEIHKQLGIILNKQLSKN